MCDKIKILISKLLIKEHLSLTKLANMLRATVNKNENPRNLCRKVNQATLRLNEFLDILELLGYELRLEKTRKIDVLEL